MRGDGDGTFGHVPQDAHRVADAGADVHTCTWHVSRFDGEKGKKKTERKIIFSWLNYPLE